VDFFLLGLIEDWVFSFWVLEVGRLAGGGEGMC